jgi:O-antigen ligase
MSQQHGDALQPITAVVHWWGKGVFFFLIASILLLGIGRLELPWARTGFSAWSISRTTFFFWLIWKVLLWLSDREKGRVLKRGWFPLPLLIFSGVVTISLLPDFHEAADYRYFFFAVMHCVMIHELFATPDRKKLLLLLLGLLPAIIVVRGVSYNMSVLTFEQMNRFPYPFMHPNSAGLLLSMSIPLALGVVLSQNSWLRNVALGSLAAQFGGLVLTYSRGAWLASMTSLFGLSLMEQRLRKPVFALGSTALIVFVAIAPLRHRVLSLISPGTDVAIEGRLRFMTDALKVGLQRPFFGVGYGRDRLREGVRQANPNADQFGFIPHSHNLYTELLAETGLVGLGAFLWMVVSNIARLIRRAQSELAAHERIGYLCLASSLIAFLVDGLGDVPFYNHETRIFFFTLIALTYLVLGAKSLVIDRPMQRFPSRAKTLAGRGSQRNA